jgi:hypothetical protein
MLVTPLPRHTSQLRISFPDEHVLLITLHRPEVLNTMTPEMESDMKKILDWFDSEPGLWQVGFVYVYDDVLSSCSSLQGCYCDGRGPRVLCRSGSQSVLHVPPRNDRFQHSKAVPGSTVILPTLKQKSIGLRLPGTGSQEYHAGV